MTNVCIGYVYCSNGKQDLAAQRVALLRLGVADERMYTGQGITGTTWTRPSFAQALAALGADDTLVVKLARSPISSRRTAWQAAQTLRQAKRELRRMHSTGDYLISNLTEAFPVSRTTIHKTLAP